MGCDIHLYVERKTPDGWEHVPGCQWYESKRHLEGWKGKHNNPYAAVTPSELPCFDVHRNYWLFSILAGVRNYNELTPISEPKGFPPPDVSDYVYNEERWERGEAHSHSWLTLAELQSYDWTGVTIDGQTMAEGCHEFVAEVMPELVKLGAPEDVRIVFWFDN